MPKVLSQSGISLADVYDVKGSIVGVENLEAADVSLVHEMGTTIFSERMGGGTLRFSAGAQAQNANFEVLSGAGNFPEGVTRILGVQVFLADSSASGEVASAAVCVRAPNGGGLGVPREFPIWIWHETDDNQQNVRYRDDGTLNRLTFLVPRSPVPGIPSFLFGTEQPSVPVPELTFRGTMAAFGAGTIEPVVLIYISNAQTVRPSSVGLPVPSW